MLQEIGMDFMLGLLKLMRLAMLILREQNVQKMSKAIGVMLVMSVVNLGATCETTTTTIVNKKKVR